MDQTKRADWLESAREAWSLRSEAWDQMSRANAHSADRQAELDRWEAALQLRPGIRLLDAGCGTGQFSIAFAERECKVVGVDLSPAMIDRARQNASRSGVDVEFHASPLTLLPASEGPYGAIFCRMVLHLVPEPFAVLREFRRVLDPGGRIYVSVPGALSPIRASSWRRHLSLEERSMNDMLPWELEALLVELEWRIVEEWGDWSGQERTPLEEAGKLAQATDNALLLQATSTTWGFIAE